MLKAMHGHDSAARSLRSWLPRGRELQPEAFRVRHRGILALLVAHAIGLPVFGMLRGYSLAHSLLDGGIIAGLVAVAAVPALDRKVRSVVAATGLVTCSAMMVHLSGGAIEAHFHFFVILGLLTLYQDWLPYLVALGYVVLHHGIVGVLAPVSVYEHGAGQRNPWIWAAIHGAFVLSASVVQLVSWRANEIEQARAAALDAQLQEQRFRKREALEINDTILQELVVAKLAHTLGHEQDARDALDEAIERARDVISDLLGEEHTAPVRAGDLVRDVAATPAKARI
jgi:signal transduction histidine kinase